MYILNKFKFTKQHSKPNTHDAILKYYYTYLDLRLIYRLILPPGQQVAFMAHTPARTLTQLSMATFTRVITNIGPGPGFDHHTGLFTCTVPGLYEFSATLRSKGQGHYVICWIRQNDNDIVFAETDAGQTDDSGSATAYLPLIAGDTVGLKCGGWEMVDTFSGTMFSGALISPDR